jgi:hypothetical protein
MEENPSGIQTYFHCRRCVSELQRVVEETGEPQSPRDYARLEVGLMPNGDLRVWCRRHEMEVTTLSDLAQNVSEEEFREALVEMIREGHARARIRGTRRRLTADEVLEMPDELFDRVEVQLTEEGERLASALIRRVGLD